MKNYIKHFNEIDINNVPEVGGKNANFQKVRDLNTSQWTMNINN